MTEKKSKKKSGKGSGKGSPPSRPEQGLHTPEARESKRRSDASVDQGKISRTIKVSQHTRFPEDESEQSETELKGEATAPERGYDPVAHDEFCRARSSRRSQMPVKDLRLKLFLYNASRSATSLQTHVRDALGEDLSPRVYRMHKALLPGNKWSYHIIINAAYKHEIIAKLESYSIAHALHWRIDAAITHHRPDDDALAPRQQPFSSPALPMRNEGHHHQPLREVPRRDAVINPVAHDEFCRARSSWAFPNARRLAHQAIPLQCASFRHLPLGAFARCAR